jgi:hypothetical protein
MLKSVILSCALIAAGSAALADETVIREHKGPSVTVTAPVPGVVIKKHEPSVVIKKDETVGRGGCDSKTVHREGPGGSTTVKKENCD